MQLRRVSAPIIGPSDR